MKRDTRSNVDKALDNLSDCMSGMLNVQLDIERLGNAKIAESIDSLIEKFNSAMTNLEDEVIERMYGSDNRFESLWDEEELAEDEEKDE